MRPSGGRGAGAGDARSRERGDGWEATASWVIADAAGNALFVGEYVFGSRADPQTDSQVIGFAGGKPGRPRGAGKPNHPTDIHNSLTVCETTPAVLTAHPGRPRGNEGGRTVDWRSSETVFHKGHRIEPGVEETVKDGVRAGIRVVNRLWYVRWMEEAKFQQPYLRGEDPDMYKWAGPFVEMETALSHAKTEIDKVR
jgi:hypothetical protein